MCVFRKNGCTVAERNIKLNGPVCSYDTKRKIRFQIKREIQNLVPVALSTTLRNTERRFDEINTLKKGG